MLLQPVLCVPVLTFALDQGVLFFVQDLRQGSVVLAGFDWRHTGSQQAQAFSEGVP